MNKIPCEVIQDLMPSYIDGLTSPVTSRVVEGHAEGCEKCRKMLEHMRQPDGTTGGTEELSDRQEIDFLKKTRKRTRGVMLGSIAAALVIVVLALAGKAFLLGSPAGAEAVTCNLDIDGNNVSVTASAISDDQAVSSVDFKEMEGVVTISYRTVTKSPLHKGNYQSEYTAPEEITQVCIGDRILWDHGMTISALTSAVYQTRHDYVGSMPDNGETARVLNMAWYLGSFRNELQTDQEPYGWTMILDDEIPENILTEQENRMRNFAYVLLGVTGNLGEVSYRYRSGEKEYTLTVTAEDASAFLGSDIKACGENVSMLETLIQKTRMNGFDDSPLSSAGKFSEE